MGDATVSETEDRSFLGERATIAKSSSLPHDSPPRVTSPAAIEGNMQQTINKLTALCTSLQRRFSELAVKFEAQEIEITRLKARVKHLEDRKGVPTGSDVVPTASPVFATATVVTPYRRRKGKEVMVEFETSKKQKVQEQIDAQVSRELEEQLETEDQIRSAQIARG
nr:hypothetical protein [Tanacetum cinerariifolium]